MKRSSSSPITPILMSSVLLLALGGACAKERAQIEALESSITDELAALRREIAEAKLAPNDNVDIDLEGVGPNTKISIVDPPRKSSCKNPQANCGKEVRWTLRGAIPQGWSVKIAEKADSPDKGCFAQPTLRPASATSRAGSRPSRAAGQGRPGATR